MKKYIWIILAAVTLITPIWSQSDSKQTVEDPEFIQARQLFWSGRYAEAEEKFKIYLLGHPKHQSTISFLQMIAQAKKNDPKSKKFDPSSIDQTRKRLEDVRIEKIEFNGTPWKAVAEYLQEKANPGYKKDEKVSKEGSKQTSSAEYINFIHMIPENFGGKVTLDLNDISLLKAIDYATRQAGLTFVIDKSAVIFEVKDAKK